MQTTIEIQDSTGATAVDAGLAAKARSLRQHARSLRSQAGLLSPVLATTYRRRAAELELEAWAVDALAGVRHDGDGDGVEVDLTHQAA